MDEAPKAGSAGTQIRLQNKHFTVFPKDELQNPAIELLQLTQNDLSSVPKGTLDHLKNLKTLILDDNAIATLEAKVFDKCTKLEVLQLSGNKISKLPEGIFDKLTNLKELYLERNIIKSLPAGIFDKLVNLKELRLSKNKLTSLPDGIFNNLKALEKLSLSENHIPISPALFNSLGNLKLLRLVDMDLSDDAIQPGIFDPLAQLQTLFLTKNKKITKFPPGLFDNVKLTSLYIDDGLCEAYEHKSGSAPSKALRGGEIIVKKEGGNKDKKKTSSKKEVPRSKSTPRATSPKSVKSPRSENKASSPKTSPRDNNKDNKTSSSPKSSPRSPKKSSSGRGDKKVSRSKSVPRETKKVEKVEEQVPLPDVTPPPSKKSETSSSSSSSDHAVVLEPSPSPPSASPSASPSTSPTGSTIDAHAAEVATLNHSIKELESKVAEQEQKLAALEQKKKKSSSSSSSDGEELKNSIHEWQAKGANQATQVEHLLQQIAAAEITRNDRHQEKAKIEEAQAIAEANAQRINTTIIEQDLKIAKLENEIARAKEKANEIQQEIQKLSEKTSPRFPKGEAESRPTGAMPAWKQRQLEKEKEEEEKRQAERTVKLTKVASIKQRKDELGADRVEVDVEGAKPKEAGARPLFRAHQEKKPEVESNVDTSSGFQPSGMTPEEMEAAEEARLMRNFNKANKK